MTLMNLWPWRVKLKTLFAKDIWGNTRSLIKTNFSTQQTYRSCNKQSLIKDHSKSPSYSLERKKLDQGKEIAYDLAQLGW